MVEGPDAPDPWIGRGLLMRTSRMKKRKNRKLTLAISLLNLHAQFTATADSSSGSSTTTTRGHTVAAERWRAPAVEHS